MNLINPSVEYIPQEQGLDGIYKQIELAGRNCYKSENKIIENSAKAFVQRMIDSGHLAMLEHGTVYLEAKGEKYYNIFYRYLNNSYSKVNYAKSVVTDAINIIDFPFRVTTNYRVLVEKNWLDDLQYLCEPTEYHQRRITLKFTTNIGVTREGNRHRVNSIAEESTRYCDYTKEKFNSGLNVCVPLWFSKEQIEKYENQNGHFELDDYMENILLNEPCDALSDIDYYLFAMYACEFSYNNLIRLGWSPQQAREVLPLATKSDVVYTAFVNDWRHFFDLRLVGTTGKPHPNMEQVAWLAQQELIKNNLWDLIYDPNNKSDKI